jgi:enoyl-CoA hydratase/carnithine racemase
MEATMQYAQEIAENVPSSSLAVIKRQVYRHPELSRDDAVRESNVVMFASTKGAAFREGVSSFLEKRKPRFGPYDSEAPLVKAMEKWGPKTKSRL